ncbi:glycoside hydrolase 43 family protein [Hymenobacter sp. GOD-10R]|uniref:glycoside hydrolase family 43 protein n=1 Tax=Hymenobacter sp. GOD-10R TaxID=3093922 RepID=UPI002D7922E3|nr:glycoside hydrolase 43 family protein [Hymenobacter sp. GOD-10R]WRQ26942.1 glycoside hydrolase 43 family protein [Hymenobacter sp. GOD-10R]
MSKVFVCLLFSLVSTLVRAQVWQPDNGDGTYKNPIIYADYSDPDVIRVGDDYYMVASSFTCQPGVPVLHSKDLVSWQIINYVYTALPFQRYQKPQHGQGSWAPSIRYHNGKYYVYFCTPEEGLFMASTTNPVRPWKLELVQNVGNWEDPCPFWDDDGQAYLLHGRVGAGPAILHKMSADGKKLLDDGKVIYQDDKKQPVLEGFKFMEKRDGYYYFAAPAGGVGTGWQSVFRSKNIYGPYEDKIVLQQGKTNVNGPHQGGFVSTQTGEWWFIHFQDKDAYGRIVHLQPVAWQHGWPVTGQDEDGDGTGEPVLTYRKPNVGKSYPAGGPQTSDDFSQPNLGLQWQWHAAPQKQWYTLNPKAGTVRLHAAAMPTDNGSLFYAGNLLLQKFTAPAFEATTKLTFKSEKAGERAGLAVMGNYYTSICLEQKAIGSRIVVYEGKRQDRKYLLPRELASIEVSTETVWFRVRVNADATCAYSYSLDGNSYQEIGGRYPVEKGTWIGAKVGLFCLSPSVLKSKGYADFDFFSVAK